MTKNEQDQVYFPQMFLFHLNETPNIYASASCLTVLQSQDINKANQIDTTIPYPLKVTFHQHTVKASTERN